MQQGVRSGQHAERVDWWPKIEAIDSMLAKQRWKAARKQAARITHFVNTEAWGGGELASVIGELALQQAIAEINLGDEREALWHWYIATNLAPEVARRDLSDFERAAELLDHQPRALEEIPSGFDRLTELEALHLEPPRFPQIAPPDIVTNAAAALRRQPDVTVEAILDKSGALREPVVWTEDAHPILVYVAIDWLSKMPPAVPARLDGRAVDSLQLLTVTFELVRTGGQIFMLPPDN